MRAFSNRWPRVLESWIADDGEELHLRILGAGPPVVFLHGWTSNHAEWLPYARAIADGRRCYCWDARGHGGHRLRTATQPSLERMARDLRNLIEHFELDQLVVLGHSMGALTVWEYISRYGCERLAGLCLIDQSPKLITDEHWPHGVYGDFADDRNASFIQRLEEDFADAVLRLAADGNNTRARDSYARNSRGFQRVREYLATLRPAPLIDIWRSLSRADFRDVLPRITVPTLLVHGDESHFYSVELAEYVSSRIPNAQLHIYEGTDHSPHLWQRERFIQDLRAFLGLEQPPGD